MPSAAGATVGPMTQALCLLVGLLLGAGLVLLVRRAPREGVLDADPMGPVREGLSRLDAQLTSLNRERHEARGRLDAQLRSLAESQDRLRTETGALVGALRKPQTRGRWGEMQLRRVVELAGMVRHCDFAEQRSVEGEAGRLRPDLVVNLPGDKHVVVDAKAPLEAVLDAYEAADEAGREAALAAHARHLRRHVRLLGEKAYSDTLAGSPDFVVLFLPGEHLYSLALEADPEIIEDAMARRVLIATPTTLLALLRSVAYGWQQEQVAESAQALADLGRELHGRLARLAGLLATLGARLGSTVRAYNETVGSFEARVLPSARRLADHGAAGPEVTPPVPVAVAVREVHAVDEAPQPAALSA
jgi:DNA recombination protein RmuC